MCSKQLISPVIGFVSPVICWFVKALLGREVRSSSMRFLETSLIRVVEVSANIIITKLVGRDEISLRGLFPQASNQMQCVRWSTKRPAGRWFGWKYSGGDTVEGDNQCIDSHGNLARPPSLERYFESCGLLMCSLWDVSSFRCADVAYDQMIIMKKSGLLSIAQTSADLPLTHRDESVANSVEGATIFDQPTDAWNRRDTLM